MANWFFITIKKTNQDYRDFYNIYSSLILSYIYIYKNGLDFIIYIKQRPSQIKLRGPNSLTNLYLSDDRAMTTQRSILKDF